MIIAALSAASWRAVWQSHTAAITFKAAVVVVGRCSLQLQRHCNVVAVERSGHMGLFGALEELTGLHLTSCNDDKAPMKPLGSP